MRTLSLTFLLTVLAVSPASSLSVTEDFSGETSKGIAGPVAGAAAGLVVPNLGGVSWTVLGNDAFLRRDTDFAMVSSPLPGTESFTWNNTKAGCANASCNSAPGTYSIDDNPAWSKDIDATGYTDLELSFNYGTTGSGFDFENDGAGRRDDLFLRVLLDGISALEVDLLSSGGTNGGGVSFNLADASLVSVLLFGNSTAAGRQIYFDDFSLEGTAASSGGGGAGDDPDDGGGQTGGGQTGGGVTVVPLPPTVILLLGAVSGLIVLRRKGADAATAAG